MQSVFAEVFCESQLETHRQSVNITWMTVSQKPAESAAPPVSQKEERVYLWVDHQLVNTLWSNGWQHVVPWIIIKDTHRNRIQWRSWVVVFESEEIVSQSTGCRGWQVDDRSTHITPEGSSPAGTRRALCPGKECSAWDPGSNQWNWLATDRGTGLRNPAAGSHNVHFNITWRMN